MAAGPTRQPLASGRCTETQYPADAAESLQNLLIRMSSTDRFELFYWASQDTTVSHASGSSVQLVDSLSHRFNLMVQYRYDPTCQNFEIDRLWVLPVGQAHKPVVAVPVALPIPPKPDPALDAYLHAHGVRPSVAR